MTEQLLMSTDVLKIDAAHKKAEAKRLNLWAQLKALCREPIKHMEIPSNMVNESVIKTLVTKITSVVDAIGLDLNHPSYASYTKFYSAHPTGGYWSYHLENVIVDCGLEWCTKRGTFPKRIARAIKQFIGLNLEPDVLAWIGNRARDTCDNTKDFYIDFTDSLDWPDGAFGDSGSCYWGGRQYARHLLMKKRCCAMRFWSPNALDYSEKESAILNGHGIGRMWVLPFKKNTEDILVAFNAYRTDGRPCIHSARILSTIMGCFYKRISLCNYEETDGIIYINGGKGFALGSQETIESVERLDLCIAGPWGVCRECGDEITREADINCPGDESDDPENILCPVCFEKDENYKHTCVKCGTNWYSPHDADEQSHDTDGSVICPSCANNMYSCGHCGNYSNTPLVEAYRVAMAGSEPCRVVRYTVVERCQNCVDNDGSYMDHHCPNCGADHKYASTNTYTSMIDGQNCHECQEIQRS